MQTEFIVGMVGLLLLAAVILRGGTALAAFAHHRLAMERQNRNVFEAFRARPPGGQPVVGRQSRSAPNQPPQSRAPQSRPPQSRAPQSRPSQTRPPQTQPVQSRPPQNRQPPPHSTRDPSASPPTARPPSNAGAPAKLQLVVAKRVVENAKGDICSFYLGPADGKPLPPFLPGQFLAFTFPTSASQPPITRCYSLSMHPTEPQEFYRISVKRLTSPPNQPNAGPPGVLSNFLHDQVPEGSVMEAMPPSGSFYLDQSSDRPVVLIAGGIGMTPIICMLDWLAAVKSTRRVLLVYGTRNSHEHAFQDHLKLISQSLPNFKQVVFYSKPTTTCRKGVDYDEVGHVSADYLKKHLRAGNYEFYMCGPGTMMRTMTQGLRQWGVPENAIMTEAFGPATNAPQGAAAASPGAGARRSSASKITVEMARSKKKLKWTGRQATLLDLAEASGINARHACRAGQCGTCKVGLRSGEVEYVSQPGSMPEPGSCLPCVARPKTDVVLDL